MRYSFGHYILDTECQELQHAGTPVPLRRKVFQVLVYLLAHHERVVPKHELLERLWPDQFVGDEALKSCIKTLRQALGERGRTPRFIHTVHGQGYRLVAAVEEWEPLLADDPPHALPHYEAAEAICQAAVLSAALPPPHADPSSPPEEAMEGEHKQVTVLCGALAEAPALAPCLSPEAMYHRMRAVLALAQATVQRYGGTLLQVSGEGFVALFGAPVAQEDHARRAVLAACELRQRLHAPDALRDQAHSVALCLGLHTGPVVVGPLVHDPQLPYAAVGDTLQVATRLQQQAAPDTVLVSAATYRLVQDEVQGEAWAPLTPELSSTSVDVYAIRGLQRRRAGVPRRDTRPLSRFVDRTQELTLLRARLAQAVNGQGQVLGIVGEPGMGKSRLLIEFARSLDGRPITYGEGHCLTYGSAAPYLPVRDLLRQLWHLPDAVPAPAVTATIHQRLREAGVASEDEALVLLQLLDVPVDVAPLAALSPEIRKARTFALLRHLFRYASQQQPLVLAVENLHWSDPTSEEWLASLVEQLGDMPVLLLTTYRPGYQPPWLRHSATTQMALPRLSPHDSLAMLQSMPQAVQLSAPLQQAIVAKAAGNPFFVEELTWAAVTHDNHAGSLPLPDTIEAVLAARLDRLPPEEKRLVRIAAVIGPEVPVPLLQTIAELSEEALQRSLAHLQATEFLYETRLFPEPVYTFKHALIHDVAYSSLLQERRRVLHACIVETLEVFAGDQAAGQVERLAHHAFRGEVWEKAVTYGQQVGTRAYERAAFREAVASFEQALQALAHLPEHGDTRVLAIDLRLALRTSLAPLGEYRRCLALLREAEALAMALADWARRGRVLALMTNILRITGDHHGAITAGRQALELAAQLGKRALQVEASQYLGQAYYAIGDFVRAAELLRWSVQEADRVSDTFTTNRRSQSQARLATVLSALGAFAEGRHHGEEALRLATLESRGQTPVIAHSSLGTLYLAQGDLEHASRVLEQGLALCRASGDRSWLRGIVAALSHAYALQGRLAEGRSLVEEEIREGRSTGDLGHYSRWVAWLSEICRLAGRGDEALQYARQALDLARQLKERGNEALALHQLGTVHAHADPLDAEEAETYYQQALALADELGMRPLQAHCHLGLGTLYMQTDRRAQARAALATAIALYRAMEMTFWLPQAEAALAHVEEGGRGNRAHCHSDFYQP